MALRPVSHQLKALFGTAVGDAMGMPYEFKHTKVPADHIFDLIPHEFGSRFCRRWIAAGQYSDDTEMSILALRTPIVTNPVKDFSGAVEEAKLLWEHPTPEVDRRIEAYGGWANIAIEGDDGKLVHTVTMGKNTRELFAEAKSVDTIKKRWHNKFDNPIKREEAQSNGALMRSSIYVASVGHTAEWAIDCYITNPSTIALQCEYIYLSLLNRLALHGRDKSILLYCKELVNHVTISDPKKAKPNPIRDAFEFSDSIGPTPRIYLGKPRGWVVTAMYYVFSMLHELTEASNLYTIINRMMHLYVHDGADTDTIAAITFPMVFLCVDIEMDAKNRITNPLEEFAVLIEKAINWTYPSDTIRYLRPRCVRITPLIIATCNAGVCIPLENEDIPKKTVKSGPKTNLQQVELTLDDAICMLKEGSPGNMPTEKVDKFVGMIEVMAEKLAEGVKTRKKKARKTKKR